MLEVGPDHAEPRERDKMVLEAEPETKKPRKKSLRLRMPFFLSLTICLPELILKSYFAERQFQAPDNIWKFQNTNQNRHSIQFGKF